MYHKHHVKHTSKKCTPDRLKSESKGDTNETLISAVPVHLTDEYSLVRGGRGYNQDSYVYFATGCGGWVFVGVDGVVCVDVEGHSVLSGC